MLPTGFVNRMKEQLGADYPAYEAAMRSAPVRALRVNPLKTDAEALARLFPCPLTPVSGADGCFLFGDEVPVGRTFAHAAGLIYVQEPSASLPARLLCPTGSERVLDLCAAPGGKTGQLAAMMRNGGLLVANEPVPSRAAILVQNLERLGVTNAVVTNSYPDALEAAYPGFFDAILVDAPCSGEGMFRKEPNARADWSPENVRACAERQGHILDSAVKMLKPTGRIVYATCTFSPEEDEDTVGAFLSRHNGFTVSQIRKVYPQDGVGEGQFMALLTRTADEASVGRTEPAVRPREAHRTDAKKTAAPRGLLDGFLTDTLRVPLPREPLFLDDGRVFLPPEGYLPPKGIRVLRAGVLLGDVKPNRFEPDHALALALPSSAFLNTVPLDEAALKRYFAGETVPCDTARRGFAVVTFSSIPVGWGKAVSGTLKNRYPKGLRVV